MNDPRLASRRRVFLQYSWRSYGAAWLATLPTVPRSPTSKPRSNGRHRRPRFRFLSLSYAKQPAAPLLHRSRPNSACSSRLSQCSSSYWSQFWLVCACFRAIPTPSNPLQVLLKLLRNKLLRLQPLREIRRRFCPRLPRSLLLRPARSPQSLNRYPRALFLVRRIDPHNRWRTLHPPCSMKKFPTFRAAQVTRFTAILMSRCV